jgi:hypothetical protein
VSDDGESVTVWSEWFPKDEDGGPATLTLGGNFGVQAIPALIARLQDFHCRAVMGSLPGLLDLPAGRVRYEASGPLRFAQHPEIEGWLVVGPAERLAPGTDVVVEQRDGERVPVRVLRWMAGRMVLRHDSREYRLWVMASFDRHVQEEP